MTDPAAARERLAHFEDIRVLLTEFDRRCAALQEAERQREVTQRCFEREQGAGDKLRVERDAAVARAEKAEEEARGFAVKFLGFIRDIGEVNEPGTEHLSPSEPGQGSHLSGSSSGDERDSPATKREDEVPGSLTSARMARPTVNDVSTIFNDTWSDLPVRFYLDGEEIRFDGGPEERTVARDSGLPGEPEWYEVYFVRIPDVTGKVLGQASAAGEETS